MEQFVKSVPRVTTIDTGLEVAILLYYSIVTDDRESVTKSANKALSRPELHSVAGKKGLLPHAWFVLPLPLYHLPENWDLAYDGVSL